MLQTAEVQSYLFDILRSCDALTAQLSATILLTTEPMFWTQHSTVSPTARNCGGFMKAPTPGGVPVRIRSPGSSTVNLTPHTVVDTLGKPLSLCLFK